MTVTTQRASSSNVTAIAGYLAFIVIGMAAGLLGVAWPAMRLQYELGLDAVAILLTANTAGYLTSSFVSGLVAERIRYGRMFVLVLGLICAGMFGMSAAPGWILLIAAWGMVGAGGGLIDAGMNGYMAAHHSARVMNWLHASFGVGLTIAPLIMGWAVAESGPGWNLGFAAVGAMTAVMFGAFLFLQGRWLPPPVHHHPETGVSSRAALVRVVRSPLVWLSVLMFMMYAGAEVLPGQWGFPLFTEARGMNAERAAFWVSAFWLSFTVGRIFFGAIMPYLNLTILQRSCMAGTLVGAVLFWWNPSEVVGIAGILIAGFSQAPIFPLFMINTPKILGAARAQYAVGFQVAGAGLGIALLPGLAGIVASRISLEVIAPFLVVTVAILIVISEVLPLFAVRSAPTAVPQAAGD